MLKKLLILWLLVPATPPTIQEITFYCQPEDAEVYLDISGEGPYCLGRCGRKLPIDVGLFVGHSSSVIFRRAGWVDETRQIDSYYFSLQPGGRDRYPDASQGPVRLTPRSDPGSRARQAAFWISHYWPAVLLALGLTPLLLRQRPPQQVILEKVAPAGIPWELPVGARVGKYVVRRRLGEGVSAVVYEVEGDLALKLLKSSEATARFRREMKALQRLNHPGIPTLFDFDEYLGLPYLVMELLSGSTLRQRLQKGPLERSEAVTVLAELAQTLAFAHKVGVLHRDVKPDNIVFHGGRVCLTDFGLARSQDSTTLTAEGTLLGTAQYMAPELFDGKPTDEKTDQYALGCVAYELLTGSPPFRGETPLAVAVQHMQSPVPPLPDPLFPVIERMLAKNPEERFATLEDVQAQVA